MKIYLIDKEDVARQLGQLLKLNSECAKLHWSRTTENLSKDVIESLETIESFVEGKVYAVCTEKKLVGSLTENEETEMMALLRKNPELRSTLGTGVVMAGEEAKTVTRFLDGKKISNVLTTAIASGKNVILF